MFERMHNAKVTCDEMKVFYSSMLESIEEDLSNRRDSDRFSQPEPQSKRNTPESSWHCAGSPSDQEKLGHFDLL